MKPYTRVRRFAALLIACLIATLTLSVVVRATQVITTPNAAFFTYSLANGASSAPITPVVGQAVLVMGTQTAFGFRGVGHVTMLHIGGSEPTPHFLEWTGLSSPASPGVTGGATIEDGFNSAAGTHILWIDWFHMVDLQVNTADSFVVHNASGKTATGNVTMIW
jgi:hypothetical protein